MENFNISQPVIYGTSQNWVKELSSTAYVNHTHIQGHYNTSTCTYALPSDSISHQSLSLIP